MEFVYREAYEKKSIRLQNQYMQSMGERIRQLRKMMGLSQERLAELLEIKQPSLSDIETGKTETLASSTLVGLVKHLRTTHEFILQGADPDVGIETAIAQAELANIYAALSRDKRAELLGFARGLLAGSKIAEARDIPELRPPGPVPHKTRQKVV